MSDTDVAQRLAEIDALRRRVLNVIPHALRTPITTFRGLAEAIEGASEEEIRTQIGPALKRLATQAEHLLDDMLIAAGYTTALPTAAAEPTPVVVTARAVWSERGQDELIVEGDEVSVVAPRGALFKILVHLLDNAAKYGDGPVTLRVVSSEDGVVFDVVTSAGVPDGELRMLTEPFFRGEAAVMRSPGLGVGLTVAKALVEQAGGTLTVLPGDRGGLVTRVTLQAA